MKVVELTNRALQLPEGSSERQAIESIVRKHPFLDRLTPHQYRVLSDCAMPAQFHAGERIFSQDEPANHFYLIQSGKVALESRTDEDAIHVQTIGAGEALGWSWLFPPYSWRFDARALELTDAIQLDAAPLRNECEVDHDLGYELILRMGRVAVRRLEATRWKLLDRLG